MRLRGWAAFAFGAWALVVLANVFTLVAFLQRVLLIGQVESNPAAVTADDPAASDATVRAGTIAAAVVALLAGVAFLGWMFVCARRVQRERPSVLRRGPGWAIGSWFIPFANLVLPAQTMNDLWAAGTPRPEPPQRGRLVAWWWGIVLATSVVATGTLEVLFSSSTDTLDDARQGAIAGIVLYGVLAVGALANMVIVSRVTQRLATMTPDVTVDPQLAAWPTAEPALAAAVPVAVVPPDDVAPPGTPPDLAPAAPPETDESTAAPVEAGDRSRAGAVVAVVVIALLVLAAGAASWRLSRPGTGASRTSAVVVPQTLGGLPRSTDSQITAAVSQARSAMAPQAKGEAFDVAGYGSPSAGSVAVLFVVREQTPAGDIFSSMGLSAPTTVGSSQCASSSAGLVVCVRTAPGLTVMVEGNSPQEQTAAMVDQAWQAQ